MIKRKWNPSKTAINLFANLFDIGFPFIDSQSSFQGASEAPYLNYSNRESNAEGFHEACAIGRTFSGKISQALAGILLACLVVHLLQMNKMALFAFALIMIYEKKIAWPATSVISFTQDQFRNAEIWPH
jgi:hypothetical protein